MGAIKRSLRDDLWWGIRYGAVGAAVFTGIAAVTSFLRLLLPEARDERIPPLIVLALAYAFGGISAGILAGVLRPLLSYWVMRRLAGMLGAIPISVAFQISTSGLQSVGAEIKSTLGFAAIWGFAMSLAVDRDALAPLRRGQKS